MFKALFFILGSAVLFSTAQAQQTCFDAKPAQLNFSCESRSGDEFLQIEVLDVTNAAVSKEDFYMGIGQYGASGSCYRQTNLLKTVLKNSLKEAKLIALCKDIEEPKLVRIALRPLPPYITVLDEKVIPRNVDCVQEMNVINNQP